MSDHRRLHLLGMDGQSALTLTAGLAQTHRVTLTAGEHRGGWSLLRAQGEGVEGFYQEACGLFAPKAFVADSPFAYAIEQLSKAGKRITLAESCTGGQLAAAFTAIGGVSAVFEGSIVTYSDRLKTLWLGVDEEVLKRFGAVSQEVVEAMALGAIKASDADYALAISGVAGPSGGSAAKPVGTVFVASAGVLEGVFAERLQLGGDRAAIQRQALCHALRLLFEHHLLKN